MQTNPIGSLSTSFRVNFFVFLLLILFLIGARFRLEQAASAVPYPYWLALSDDKLAVLYGNTIYVCDGEGRKLRTVAVPERILPCQLSWHDNELFISDWRNHALHFFGSNGILTVPLTGGPRIRAHQNAAIDDVGNAIYVTDSAGSRIHVYDRSGRYLRSFGDRGHSHGQFYSPKDIRLLKGRLYVGNVIRSGVDVFSTEGKFLQTIVEPKGFWLNSQITDFDVDEGRVATIECNGLYEDCRITAYDGKGTVLATIPQPSGAESVGDIAMRNGVITVSDTVNRKITRYDAKTLREIGPASAELNELGETLNRRYLSLKNYSIMTVVALVVCLIVLLLLLRQHQSK